MARDIPLGNGSFVLLFDEDYQIRDIFYPHVGMENHLTGGKCRMGTWTEGRFSWVGEGWKRDLQYEPGTLVTSVILYNEELGLLIKCRDAVDFHEDIYVRELEVENLSSMEREVRLFFTHDFNVLGNSVGDTAAFDPKTGGLIHYKEERYFLANAKGHDSEGLFQYATGQKGVKGKEGTFKDAEDGLLSGNPIAQGSVDSVISISLLIKGNSAKKASYWIVAAKNWEEARRLDFMVKHKGAQAIIKRTSDYWSLWIKKENPSLDYLPEKVRELYVRSLLVLRTHLDWKGGVIASCDSDIIHFNRDTYAYVWPRDAALVANALDLAGYPVPSQRFYKFAGDLMEKEGYLLHKYNPDSTLASSWHPWIRDGNPQLPIQEDETALVIWALWNHFVIYRDIEFVKPLYRPLIKSAADFMCSYRDEETGLPFPSYDLWEERRGVLSFTVGAVFGGITAASLFCMVFGETEYADFYQKCASEIRDAASKYLFRPELNRFCRMINLDDDGGINVDGTCDASLWGLFTFGLYAPDDSRIVSTMEETKKKLWVNTSIGGLARHEKDTYFISGEKTTGNPWFISTLWYADYLIQKAKEEKELQEGLELLEWAARNSLPSGVMPEQIDLITGAPLSVSPLTWSHGTFVACCQHLLRKLQKMKTCPSCGSSLLELAGRDDWISKLFNETCDVIHGSCKIK